MERSVLLAGAVCWALLMVACTRQPQVETIPSDVSGYHGGGEDYDLTPKQVADCKARALRGDIMSAKKLVTYHLAVTGNQREFEYWSSVVKRLQESYGKGRR